ncbi:MAG: hypothetical protein EOM26_08335 [Alphaproteobacteria bacterium]|nr:hypothetical protein [Alphaproteobacteria bacterium]
MFDSIDVGGAFKKVVGNFDVGTALERTSIGQFMTSESGTSLRNILTHPWAQMIVGGIGTLMSLKWATGNASRGAGLLGMTFFAMGFSGGWEDLWHARAPWNENSRLHYVLDGLKNGNDLAAEGTSTGAVPDVKERALPEGQPQPGPGQHMAGGPETFEFQA